MNRASRIYPAYRVSPEIHFRAFGRIFRLKLETEHSHIPVERHASMELPFTAYPLHVRHLLAYVKGDTCRHGYGLKFMQKTRQTTCAYCGLEFAASYANWLTMALDH